MAKVRRREGVHQQLALFGREGTFEQATTARARRRVEWAVEAQTRDGEDVSFLHAGFCMAALPHRCPKDDTEPWIRTNGRFKLAVWPGRMLRADGSYIDVGVPYGTKARLILLYLMTAAIQTGSRCVPTERSMSAWLRKIGLPVTGGTRGTIKPVREQALRISRCSFTLRFDEDDGRASLQDRRVVEGLHLWAADETGEWPESVELTEAFYEHLLEHAVPLDEYAIATLKSSALALDLYVWLAYRLPRLNRPMFLTWPQLVPQFGSQIRSLTSFAQNFRDALLDVLAVYPGARIEIVTGGIELHPSPPAVGRDLVQVPGFPSRVHPAGLRVIMAQPEGPAAPPPVRPAARAQPAR